MILCLIWLSSAQLPVFISFLMVLPVLYNNVLQGFKTADPQLLEMAGLYGVPFGRRLVFIHLPQIKPFLLSACGVALGMAWKAGVAAEVIGITSGSIGEKDVYKRQDVASPMGKGVEGSRLDGRPQRPLQTVGGRVAPRRSPDGGCLLYTSPGWGGYRPRPRCPPFY